jgi:hypothetical protein
MADDFYTLTGKMETLETYSTTVQDPTSGEGVIGHGA